MDDPAAPDSALGEITDEMIGQRAYEISQSEHAGSPQDNWFRAAQELRTEAKDAGSDTADT